MIPVTNLGGEKFYLNPGLVETIEMVPDTLVTMINGRKYLLRESAQTVADRIEAYRVRILSRSGDPLYLSADVADIPKKPDELEE